MNNLTKTQSGVTLIELMIVVAIVGIIAAFAYPAYQAQAEKTRRAEGTSALTRIMDMQERYYINANFPPTYTTDLSDLGLGGATFTTENGHYVIDAAACGDGITQCVQLTATAQPSQDNDGDLTLNSLGAATRDGNAGWD